MSKHDSSAQTSWAVTLEWAAIIVVILLFMWAIVPPESVLGQRLDTPFTCHAENGRWVCKPL